MCNNPNRGLMDSFQREKRRKHGVAVKRGKKKAKAHRLSVKKTRKMKPRQIVERMFLCAKKIDGVSVDL